MLKLLIVDDELLARIGMRTIIPWEEQGIEIVGEAEDGKRALELARKYMPDIVITDIRMPEMDGLDFIRTLKAEQPECKFLVLSCMDDTAYLQEAIKLGVKGYILKNAIEPQNILEEVHHVMKEISTERVYEEQSMEEYQYVNANAVLNEFANLVLGGLITDKKMVRERFEKAFLGEEYGTAYVICMAIPPKELRDAVRGVEYSIAAICQNMMETMTNGRTFMGRDGTVWALAGGGQTEREDIISLCRRFSLTMEQYLDMHLEFGISSFGREEFDIPLHYKRAREALNRKFYMPGEGLYFYDQLGADREKEEEVAKAFERCKNISNHAVFYREMECLFSLLSRYPVLPERELKEGLCGAVFSLDVFHGSSGNRRKEKKAFQKKINEAETCGRLHCFLKEWLMELDFTVSESSDDLICTVVNYIKENIGERLTLGVIAGQVYLNPDYLCKLFKQKTGENLISYILKYKILLAKGYLMEGKRISEISEILGFSSEGHFITTFKKYAGQTPGAYLKGADRQEEITKY